MLCKVLKSWYVANNDWGSDAPEVWEWMVNKHLKHKIKGGASFSPSGYGGGGYGGGGYGGYGGGGGARPPSPPSMQEWKSEADCVLKVKQD